MKRLILFGVFVSLIACEPGDVINLPSEPKRITILSFNQVGDPWFIALTTTIPSTTQAPFTEPPTNAKVTIYEDGNIQEVLPIDNSKHDEFGGTESFTFFKSKGNSPKPGHLYKIVVEADGLPTATATYSQSPVVPAEILMSLRERRPLVYELVTTDNNGTIITYDTATQWVFDVSIKFTDPPESNYYDFWIRTATDEDSLETNYHENYLSIEGDQLGIDAVLGGQMVDDNEFSNQPVEKSFIYTFDDYVANDTLYRQPKPSWFRVSLRTMNEAQYKFNVASRKQLLAESDPYGQPVTTVTNVQNGLGVFGGYSPSSKTYYFKLE